MKLIRPLGFLLLFALIFNSCSKDDDNQEKTCCFTRQIQDSLYRSAMYLYVNDIYADTAHPNRDNPVIAQEPIEKILGQFQSIANLQIPETDTVFDILHIRANIVNTHYISMKVDPNAPEIQAMIDGQPTGNSALDNVIQQYHFTEVDLAYDYPNFNWLTIGSTQDWNILPVAEQLQGLPFIEVIETNYWFIVDGPHIEKTESRLYGI